MQRQVMNLATSKAKKGSVTYWIPVPTLHGEVPITEADKQLMGMFADTVSAHNNNVMAQNREASKLAGGGDFDLADDFTDVDAA